MASTHKDLLDQLRTVHFTLLVICLAATVIALAPDKTSLSRASQQLSELTELQENWESEIEKRLTSFAGGGVCVNRPMPAGEAIDIHSADGPFRIKITRKWDVTYDAPMEYRREGEVGELESLKPPTSLPDFRALWNTHVFLTCPLNDLNPRPGEYARGWSIVAHDFAGTPLVPDRFIHYSTYPPEKTFVWVNAHRSGPWIRAALLEFPDGGDFRWVLPANGRSESSSRRELVLHDLLGIPSSDFEQSFRQLIKEASDKQPMTLADLRRVLDSQLTAEQDTFSAFSVKFPLQASRRWAALLIVLVQFYFYVHFMEFCRRGRPVEEVAWVGAYDQVAARLLTAFTLYIVPVSVIVLVTQGESYKGHLFVSIPAIVISVLISLRLAVLDHRSRRTFAASSSPTILDQESPRQL